MKFSKHMTDIFLFIFLPFFLFFFLGSGPGGNWRGQKPVEYRGNLSVHPYFCTSVRPSIHTSIPPEGPLEAGPGLSEAGPGLLEAGPGLSEAGPGFSKAGPGFSEARPGLSEAGPGLSEAGPGLSEADSRPLRG